MADGIDFETLGETLDLVASWLLAAYGSRLASELLSLEGHYGPLSECYTTTCATFGTLRRPAAAEAGRMAGELDRLLTANAARSSRERLTLIRSSRT